ncbi:iron(III) transport system substrate-binding protein [Halanaerobium saccharolyticum]|uniref:Iron(III) transport system substrate-binding protein n=1 Tax=Halanaerobium saccharolyticum TaxID=43595 RepID=A0A4R7YV06_9FIRM|nr:Fe(3+) ABC transporter substrate-binding protein [Halanaerobium saccharolyticum]TDW00948.1 iron(III) transport system substrate-binding protein [Halanaerobium saccharolyticum]TDX52588.1 iron(III) transport system substrate-binding protein [Halanaerobium saccharolyticum]
MKKLITITILISVLIGLGTVAYAAEEVNLYTNRHYDTDEEILDRFTEETGIEVNVLKGDSDQLIERIAREGKNSPADLLITADAGRLHRAKKREILQSVESEVLNENVPANLREQGNYWFGLTVRGRVIVYSKERVDPAELGGYADLSSDKWQDEILVRSSSNIYNQSLLASLVSIYGEDWAEDWAAGVVDNMARKPQGNDRAQATAVAAGEGDLAIMNTYYLGKMLNSDNPAEVEVAENVGIHFPDGENGTHINVSGAGVVKNAPNRENAVKLLEYLSSASAQKFFASANYEYPVNPDVEASELLQSWGDFEPQNINLTELGIHNETAVKIFNRVGWQ